MVARRRRADPSGTKSRGHYFADEHLELVSSGCTVLDCVLGGGWPLGRIANIVGDKSSGKTLLAIEACANFAHAWPKGHIWYREAEAAFDVPYAQSLGLPSSRVDFGPDGVDTSWETVEDIYEDLEACVTRAEKSKQPGLYIVDSLDALSSRAELARAIDKGSYGTDKAAAMSALFRRLKKRLKRARILVIIVSQIRDRIGILFGEKHTRSGGRALDFYASQILWLHHKAAIKSASEGIERTTGVRIRAKCKKNKIGTPFHECEFVIWFGYGTDDVEAAVGFLHEVKRLDRLGIKVCKTEKEQKAEIGKYLRAYARMEGDALREHQREVATIARDVWREVEDRFKPTRKKYE